jgi:hypothetical protein
MAIGTSRRHVASVFLYSSGVRSHEYIPTTPGAPVSVSSLFLFHQDSVSVATSKYFSPPRPGAPVSTRISLLFSSLRVSVVNECIPYHAQGGSGVHWQVSSLTQHGCMSLYSLYERYGTLAK